MIPADADMDTVFRALAHGTRRQTAGNVGRGWEMALDGLAATISQAT